MPNRVFSRRAFSLIELLVCLAIIAVLISALAPTLLAAREAGRTLGCLAKQRQLTLAWTLYAAEFKDRVMPLAYWSTTDIGSGPQVFWWGTHGTPTSAPVYTRGFLAPYLDSSLRPGSVFECPSQPWGTYKPQGPSRTITSTYGYNGYYLSPPQAPGWAFSIGHRPWQRLTTIREPARVMVFADTLLPAGETGTPFNNALLDPPLLFSGPATRWWSINESPTTAFRHARGRAGPGSVVAAYGDGHAAAARAQPAWVLYEKQGIGSINGNATNGPAYVPDWESW